MTKLRWVTAAIFLLALPVLAMAQDQASLYESATPPAHAGQLDRIVFARLAKLGCRPVLCSDAVFRPPRLPGPDRHAAHRGRGHASSFRIRTQEQARRPDRPPAGAPDEFADYWAMKWGDILRIKAEFPVKLWPNAAQAYHRWVRASIAENKPYDQFARELLTSSGSNFRVGPVNFYRAIQNRTPEGIAAAVALTFMGTRVESWPEDRLAGMAVFFSQIGYKPTREWKEESVFWDPLHSSTLPGNVAPEKTVPTAEADSRQPRQAVLPGRSQRAADGGLPGRDQDHVVRRTAIRGRSSPIG